MRAGVCRAVVALVKSRANLAQLDGGGLQKDFAPAAQTVSFRIERNCFIAGESTLFFL